MNQPPPPGPAGYPGPQPPPPGQVPYGPPPRRTSRRGSGVLVLVLGLVAVAVVGVVRGVVVYRDRHPDHRASTRSSTAQPSLTTAATAVAAQLTYDLQLHDRKAFLSHMSGAGASAAGAWWTSMAAIGFDYGAVTVEDIDTQPDYDASTIKVTAAIGVHHPLGPTQSQNNGDPPRKYVPTTRYELTLSRQPGGVGTPLITRWRPLANAPWDSGTLYVVRLKNVTVAGPSSEKAFIRAQAAIAQRGAAWVLAFLRPYRGQVNQRGFVVFVSQNAKTRASWFSSSTRPRGWTADPAKVGGVFKPLPGSTVSDPGLAKAVAGGGYVVLGAPEPSAIATEQVAVHELTHALVSINDTGNFGTSQPLPAWVVEGWARYIEAYFVATPKDPTPTKYISAQPYLARSLTTARHPAFTGAPPGDAQVYGSASLADYYYGVSASVYEYLSVTYGDRVGFGSVLTAYLGGNDGPFAAVFDHSANGTQYYKDPAKVQAGWAAWYRKTYGR